MTVTRSAATLRARDNSQSFRTLQVHVDSGRDPGTSCLAASAEPTRRMSMCKTGRLIAEHRRSIVGIELRVESPSEFGDRVKGIRGPTARRNFLFPASPHGLQLLGVRGLDGLDDSRAAQAFGLRG